MTNTAETKNHTMSKGRWLLIAGISILPLLAIASLITGRSIVWLSHHPSMAREGNDSPRPKEFALLEGLDFDQGNWEAYLVIASDDIQELPEGVPKRNCFKLTDRQILKSLQSTWQMKSGSADVSTVESFLAFTQNGKLRWESGIVITDKIEGFQSTHLGWATPITPGVIKQNLKYFKPCYSPLVFL